MTSDAERGEAMLDKCEAALEALMEAHVACESLLSRDLKKMPMPMPIEPDRRLDQLLTTELIFGATGDFEAATKKLRLANTRSGLRFAREPRRTGLWSIQPACRFPDARRVIVTFGVGSGPAGRRCRRRRGSCARRRALAREAPIRADFEAKVWGDNESVSAKRTGFIG